MNDYLPYIIVGLTSGSIYAIAGMGLVLTYKTSGVLNFAHGTIAAGAAFLFYELWQRHGIPWPVAAAICIFGFAPIAGAAMEQVARNLAQADTTRRVVATVGLIVGIQGVITVIYGANVLQLNSYLPTHVYTIGGVGVGADQLIICALALAVATCLYVLFRFSRLGVAMRAAVDNADLLDLTGLSPAKTRRAGWMLGFVFAAASGILLARLLGLDVVLLTLLVVQAFGAAAVGGFTSLPRTYVGGLAVGVIAELSRKFVAGHDHLAGIPQSVPFLLLFAILVLLPRSLRPEAAVPRRPLPAALNVPMRARITGGGVFAVLLLVVPALAGDTLAVYTQALILVIVLLSLGLLVQSAGQVSLCHAALFAVGASTFSHLAVGVGLPWFVSVIGAGLVAVPVGAIVAIPAIRVSGIYLALATLGFGILIEQLFFTSPLMFGTAPFLPGRRPSLPGLNLATDTGYYYVVLGFAAVAVLATVAIGRSRMGRLLHALAEAPIALETSGASTQVLLVLVFCISAFGAGIAGALFCGLAQSVNAAGFGFFVSLTWLTVLVISGPRLVPAALIGAAAITLPTTYIQAGWVGDYQPIVFGIAAFAVAVSGGRRTFRAVRRNPAQLSRTATRLATAAP